MGSKNDFCNCVAKAYQNPDFYPEFIPLTSYSQDYREVQGVKLHYIIWLVEGQIQILPLTHSLCFHHFVWVRPEADADCMQSIAYSLGKSQKNIEKLGSTGTAELDRSKSNSLLLNIGFPNISPGPGLPNFLIFLNYKQSISHSLPCCRRYPYEMLKTWNRSYPKRMGQGKNLYFALDQPNSIMQHHSLNFPIG